MRALMLSLFALLAGVGILFTGNGLLNSLVPLKAQIAAFDPALIGVLGASYFAGFLGGCRFAPGLIRRTGHIRAFAAFASLATMVALIHGLVEQPVLWVALRLVFGFCAAALYLVVESWLNAKASPSNRGAVMGIYALVNYGALALGQQFLRFVDEDGSFLFFIVAFASVAAVLPITLTRQDAPALPPAGRLPMRTLLATSPVGVVGCFLNGMSNGPFWSLAPSFARQIDLSLAETSFFLSLPIIAGALSAWPIGMLSDRLDRRIVIGLSWSVIIALALVIAFVPLERTALYAVMALFGAVLFPINSLYVAHVNDVVTDGDRVALSSGLILLFGLGAMIGPVLAGTLMGAMGPGGLFLHIALVATLAGTYTFYRLMVRARPIQAVREPFRLLPRTTQGVSVLDPRCADPAPQPGDTPSADPRAYPLSAETADPDHPPV